MITKFKIFESERQFREVDLQLLWNDLVKYQLYLFDSPTHIDAAFESIISKLIQDKEISFHRAKHPYDDEITYAYTGRVKNIRVDIKNRYQDKKIIITLYGSTEMYILTTIHLSFYHEQNSIVKIYNSEELEIEKKIELVKSTTKYNL